MFFPKVACFPVTPRVTCGPQSAGLCAVCQGSHGPAVRDLEILLAPPASESCEVDAAPLVTVHSLPMFGMVVVSNQGHDKRLGTDVRVAGSREVSSDSVLL